MNSKEMKQLGNLVDLATELLQIVADRLTGLNLNEPMQKEICQEIIKDMETIVGKLWE